MEIKLTPENVNDIERLLTDIVVNKALTYTAHLQKHMDYAQAVGEDDFYLGTSKSAISRWWRRIKIAEGFPADRAVLTGQTKAIAEVKEGEVYIEPSAGKIEQNLYYRPYQSDPRYPYVGKYDHPFWQHLDRFAYWGPWRVPIGSHYNWEIWTDELGGEVDVKTAIANLAIPDDICQDILRGSNIKIADISKGDIGGIARSWY